jgi:parvulin-like peptidyl-prolyl isomerase
MTQINSNDERSRARGRKAWLGAILGGFLVVAICVGAKIISGGVDTATAQAPKAANNSAKEPAAGKAAVGAPIAPIGAQTKTAAATVSTSKASDAGLPADAPKLKIVASVNGESISREQLAAECLNHYGKEVLDSLINKRLIVEECKRRNITISRAEIDAEIERMAKSFGFTVDQWMKMLKQERGITPAQYANDTVWSLLALRKLAGERLKVSKQELQEAFDAQYGPAVRARLIACNDAATAKKARQAAVADPDSFGDLAKKYSVDASASVKGIIQPIRKHGGIEEIEREAFSLRDGEISQVLPVAGQFVILKREGLEQDVKVKYEQVEPQLEQIARDKKMRTVANEIFAQLIKQSKVEDYLKDPAKGRDKPGVAASINGMQITNAELADICVERYGESVLEGAINRKMIEQECKKKKVAVTKDDLDRELTRMAADMVPPKPDGSPDVDTWIKMITEKQGVPLDVFRADVIWPTAALMKLVASDVQITKDDMEKAFEANYGQRVRCRAIVLNNMRKAQEVWEKARQKPTLENFGNLAQQYTIDSGSQSLYGEVPPIGKFGGNPTLEKEAFALKPGEMSGIIQVSDKFVILFCEGFTNPVKVTMDEVRDELSRDLREKKTQIAMTDLFHKLEDTSTVDNYLAGTSRSPNQKTPGPEAQTKSGASKQSSEAVQPRAGSTLSAQKPSGTTRN